MQIEVARCELGELGEAAGDGQPRDRVSPKIFEGAADKVAHVDQCMAGKIVEALHGTL